MIHVGVSFQQSGASWSELAEGADLVESLGFDSLWTADHFVTPPGGQHADDDYLEAWVVLSGWAARTKHVMIGSLVTPVGFRNPGVLAKMAVALDHVSNGRAILGLGAGWIEQEYTQYGLEFKSPGERLAQLAETATICRSLFTDKTTTFTGKHYALVDALAEPKPLQARLPILVAAEGPAALRVTGRVADWWNGFADPEMAATKMAAIRAAASTAGRDPSAIVPSVTFRPLVIRDSPQEVETRLDEQFRRQKMKQDTKWMLSGSPEVVAARLREYIAVGVRTFILQNRVPWDVTSLERFANEVRPLLEG